MAGGLEVSQIRLTSASSGSATVIKRFGTFSEQLAQYQQDHTGRWQSTGSITTYCNNAPFLCAPQHLAHRRIVTLLKW
jgi:hypothetical protein